jgi:phage gp46-like protein
MSDLALIWNVWSADFGLAADDLAIDDGLETSVILSLFTDRRAEESDTLPDFQTDRRGWWGDDYPVAGRDRIGSRLWLLSREKELQSVVDRAVEYAREALQWLIDDRVADKVDVAGSVPRRGWLLLDITVHRPALDPVQWRFNYTWDSQAGDNQAAGGD